jgi:hypothetical protein
MVILAVGGRLWGAGICLALLLITKLIVARAALLFLLVFASVDRGGSRGAQAGGRLRHIGFGFLVTGAAELLGLAARGKLVVNWHRRNTNLHYASVFGGTGNDTTDSTGDSLAAVILAHLQGLFADPALAVSMVALRGQPCSP